MAEEIHVPGIGGMSKKTVYIIGAGFVIVVGVAYYRHKQNTANAATATPGTDIDPATGYPYNSPQDLAALQAQASAGLGGGGGTGGIVDPNGQNVPNDTTSFVDNAHWERAAVDYLSGLGESATAVSSALGKYLAGQPVDDKERSFIDQATAAEGSPPVAGANGYPPHIRAAPGGPPPAQKLAAPHIAEVHHDKTTAIIHWAAVSHAHSYIVHSSHNVSKTTTGTRITVKRPGTYWVVAHASGWTNSPESNHLTV